VVSGLALAVRAVLRVALIVAYALLGCTWLIMKTEGKSAGAHAQPGAPLAFVVLAVIGIVSIWTPLAHPDIASALVYPAEPVLVPAGTDPGVGDHVCAGACSVARNAHYAPFLLTLVLIFLGYSGLGISMWPNIIPPSISIWEAAAPPQSQGFMLVGTLFIIPFIWVTPSGATTCSAARSPMKTAITDEGRHYAK
jgi:cytochrome bd ubiquinol oxidase subunit II